MKTEIIIKKSNNDKKKYDAIIDGKKTVSFGQAGASDYTLHQDNERKERYLDRHRDRENWTDHKTAGFYSRWITWEKPTLKEAVANVNKKFPNLNVKLKK